MESQGHLGMAMTGQAPQTGRHEAQTFHNGKSMHVVEKQW